MPMIGSILNLLLMVWGNVFPFKESCYDILHHPTVFNIEWDNKY